MFFKRHWRCLLLIVLAGVLGWKAKDWIPGGSATPVFRRVRFFNAADVQIPQVKVKEVSDPMNPKTLVTLGPIPANSMVSADADSNGFFVNGLAVKNVTMMEIVITVDKVGGQSDLPAITLNTGTGSFGGVCIDIEKAAGVDDWDVLAAGFHAPYENDALVSETTTPSPITLTAP